MRRSAVGRLVVTAMIAGSCSGSPGVVNDREAAEIAMNGVNQTGLELATSEWREIGEQACQRRAWDHAAARQLAASLALEYSPADPSSLPLVVWMAAVTACRELIPEDTIKLGPPPAPGG